MNNRLALTLLVAVLASYRLYRFVALDTFPLFRVPREWLLDRWGRDSWKADGLTCPWCMGSWMSGAVVLAFAWADWTPGGWFLLPTWLAVSTLVGLIGSVDH